MYLSQKGKELYKSIYRVLALSITTSNVAGFSNAISEIDNGTDFSQAYGNACINHYILALPIAVLYDNVFKCLRNTKNHRLYANVFHASVTFGVLLWHYAMGTENPMHAILPITLVSFPIVNKNISQIESLESKINES